MATSDDLNCWAIATSKKVESFSCSHFDDIVQRRLAVRNLFFDCIDLMTTGLLIKLPWTHRL